MKKNLLLSLFQLKNFTKLSQLEPLGIDVILDLQNISF